MNQCIYGVSLQTNESQALKFRPIEEGLESERFEQTSKDSPAAHDDRQRSEEVAFHKEEEQSEEDLLHLLEITFVESDYRPIPADLVKSVGRLCDRRSIEMAILSQAPDDWRKVTISGAGVEALQADIDTSADVLKHPDFTLLLEDKDIPDQTVHMSLAKVVFSERKCEFGESN